MRSAYKYLAYAVAALVMVQAAAIAFAAFGLFDYSDNHTIVKGTEPSFTGDLGFAVHSIVGEMLIPLVVIALLIVSFLAKIPGGSKWAAFVLLDVVLQVLFAFLAFGAAAVGILHGLNALVLFGLGVMAARRVDAAVATVPETATTLATGEGAPA